MTAGAWAQVIPQALEVKARPGVFSLAPGAFAAVPHKDSKLFLETLNRAGAGVELAPADAGCAIQFLPTEALPGGFPTPEGEGYVIRIMPKVINVYAATPAGNFYGLQTVAQIIESAPKAEADGRPSGIACRDIVDKPRFAWRGYMLDESRHFTGPEGVKRLLDSMARFKLNRLHWHLTDSPGWRIEIKKYPDLTRIGGRGSETDQGPDAPVQFYTQQQIREIVAYAKARAITIIPEIDMPGHADAAVAAYPEHDGGGFVQKGNPQKWPRFTFNPAKKETLAFLDDILTEVAGLFPEAGVIHFGGDEVHFGWGKWKVLPEVQDLMKKENLKELAEVETWFNRRMAGSIHKLGFKTGGWDEIVSRGLPQDQTVVWWWRHDKPEVLKDALAKGYPVVLAPRRPCYFDFVQSDKHKDGRRWGGFNTLSDVYQFPKSLNLSAGDEAKVLGIEACLWTEAMPSQERRDFMAWPRLVALAEAGWTKEDRKDYADFESRLKPQLAWLKQHGIGYYDPFADSPEVPSKDKGRDYLDKPE